MRRKRKFEPGDFDFEMAERIRQTIRDIAKSQRITIRALSIKTGYSNPYLSRLLSGQRRLSYNDLSWGKEVAAKLRAYHSKCWVVPFSLSRINRLRFVREQAS